MSDLAEGRRIGKSATSLKRKGCLKTRSRRKGYPAIADATFRLLLSDFLLFLLFALILYGASKPMKPRIIMKMEAKRRPKSDYLEKIQKDVTSNMRGVLVDWLVEVAEEYKLLPDTLYLTVSYVDRYLSLTPINRKKLQLLGVSSMLIASKYEEISPPHVDDFCYITDNTYTKHMSI